MILVVPSKKEAEVVAVLVFTYAVGFDLQGSIRMNLNVVDIVPN